MSATKAMRKAVKTATTEQLHSEAARLLDMLTPTAPEFERNAMVRSSLKQQREIVLGELNRRYTPAG